MEIVGIVGWSGSGKTALVVSLVPALRQRGLTVSTVKHAHHNFDIDQPGKDTYEHRNAGAAEVMVVSDHRWALMHELREDTEPGLDALVARMTPVDLVLVEGFKSHAHPKIEVYRPSVGKPLLQGDDAQIVAVASDSELTEVTVPVLSLNDPATVADFIVQYCQLKAA